MADPANQTTDDHLLPVLAKVRNNIFAWLELYGDEPVNALSASEMRRDFAYLNAAIARRLPRV